MSPSFPLKAENTTFSSGFYVIVYYVKICKAVKTKEQTKISERNKHQGLTDKNVVYISPSRSIMYTFQYLLLSIGNSCYSIVKVSCLASWKSFKVTG